MELRLRRGAKLVGRFQILVQPTADADLTAQRDSVTLFAPQVEMQVGFLRRGIRALTPISLLR